MKTSNAVTRLTAFYSQMVRCWQTRSMRRELLGEGIWRPEERSIYRLWRSHNPQFSTGWWCCLRSTWGRAGSSYTIEFTFRSRFSACSRALLLRQGFSVECRLDPNAEICVPLNCWHWGTHDHVWHWTTDYLALWSSCLLAPECYSKPLCLVQIWVLLLIKSDYRQHGKELLSHKQLLCKWSEGASSKEQCWSLPSQQVEARCQIAHGFKECPQTRRSESALSRQARPVSNPTSETE